MSGYVEITEELIANYTRVMPSGDGVCDVCHGRPNQGYDICHSCSEAIAQVTHPCRLVVPISLSRGSGALHSSLRSYKDPAFSSYWRRIYVRQIAALIHRFLEQHRSCIEGAAGCDWDTVTIVPSTSGRTGPHPLEDVIHQSTLLSGLYEPLLGPGSVKVTHNHASDLGFAVTGDADGRRILVVDDTFTSGARSQSAASALQIAGARVVAIMPVARYMHGDRADELLAVARQQPFDFATCCLETPPAR